MHKVNLAAHNFKIEDRRRRVASLLAQSMTETEIAQKLNVDQSTISRERRRSDCIFCFFIAPNPHSLYIYTGITTYKDLLNTEYQVIYL